VYSIKKTLSIFILITTLFILSACNKSQDEFLRIAFDIEDEDRYEEFFAQFEELNPDIKIKALYGQDISKLIGTKDEPDIFKTGDAYIEGIARSLLPLDSFIEGDETFDLNDYHDNIIESLRVDDKLYALPTSINTSLLYYNKTIFDESASEIRLALNLGAEDSIYPNPTWTYDDFQKAGVVMTKYTGTGINRTYTQYGAETQSTWWGEWLIYVRQFGGDFYETGNNHKSALNSAAALNGTTFLYEKTMGDDTQKFSPSLTDAELSFAGGKVAMIFGGHLGDWASYNILGLDWDIQVLPKPVGRPDARGGEISTDAFGISARSKKAEQAYRFLKYWVSEEGAAEMFKYGKIGALKNMEEIASETSNEDRGNPYNIEAVFDAISIAMPLPKEKDFERVCNQRVMDKIQIMLLGQLTPSETMTLAYNAVNRYYSDLYGNS
jgi:multiple sugar transport system substrate-binding protein